ncbi:helicase HerA domain-containing protein [Anaerovibrio sp.]|uniref:helicase HerA domain-containing protein n=1 Tax=Anaerovibrio sp. TaxID=1872532 RepID=UPI00388F9FB8
MLKEFYDFIAKKINYYFQTVASDRILLKGESFCLKLDDEDMVEKVTESLRKIAEMNNSIGEFSYRCGDGSIYKTFSLKVMDNQVIIASQINGMSNDFLCATLRNAANDQQIPLLMISSKLIDSAKSGSRDLSASGMPFHADELMCEIREMVDGSTQLTETEKRILKFEIDRRDNDVFSDKASIYEYSDLLAIVSSGKIDKTHFAGFRLFPIDGKTQYQNYGKKQIDKLINENNILFEKIDRGIRLGNLESEIAKDFEESYINKMERAQNEYLDEWSSLFPYEDLLEAMQKKQAKQEKPLKIDDSDITVYGDEPCNELVFNEQFIIRCEGSQTAKRRRKNLFIFNPEHYSKIFLKINCNTKIANSSIVKDDADYNKKGNYIIFEFSGDDISFHEIGIQDESNDIRYVLKLCIVDIKADYLLSTLKHSFSLKISKDRKKSKVKIAGVGTNLVFNPNGTDITPQPLGDHDIYNCSIDQRLILYSTEEELSNYSTGINIGINFSGLVVPFTLYPDEAKSIEITGKKILRDKYATKRSFQYDDGAVFSDSQEYFVKANLLKELKAEQEILDGEIFYGVCKSFYNNDVTKIESIELNIDNRLSSAYLNLLRVLKKERTVPSLAYLGDSKIYDLALEYVNAFENCYDGLANGTNLTVEQENALYLGTISVGKNNEEILFTPLHPLNVMYQLTLLKEKNIDCASDVVLERLNSINLLPYIQRNKMIYKVSDRLFSQEWKYYAPVENKKYRGSRRYVPKLVEEKIYEFTSHFRYIFNEINNRTVRINLINMGDCSEVFVGIAQFFIHAINRNADIDKLIRLEIHIYGNDINDNAFAHIKEYTVLKNYLDDLKLYIENGTSMNNLDGIMSKNIECYFHNDNGTDYVYSHITFYEMESEITSEIATMSQIETGVSLGGILSGVPSSKYGQKYRTGFGVKYANLNDLTQLAMRYNSLMQVEKSGNPYYTENSISTQIDKLAEKKMDYIYKSSNWVVFVDPKVDLDFFTEKEATSDLLIIHYSDQYTSSSGYDAITVTQKSKQYSQVIMEYLNSKGVEADTIDVKKIINLFNAVNGDWLLRLVSSKKANNDSTFSREKISIVAAIKFMLAYLRHDDIIWVPVSLEEMLRVSGGVGLSKEDGILSAKNLGFEKGPTSDDLLFIGLNISEAPRKVYLYPIEVKTGNNDSTVIEKAFKQASSTADGLHKAFNPGGEIMETILYKVNRNFLMQLLITSCKKMQAYHVDDSQDWNKVLDTYREVLLNEEYIMSDDIKELLGKGAVLSFRKLLVSRKTSFKEESINFIEIPEGDEFGLILKDVINIYDTIREDKNDNLFLLSEHSVKNLTGDLTKLEVEKYNPESELDTDNNDVETEENVTVSTPKDKYTDEPNDNLDVDEYHGMSIIFGTNKQDGKDVVWAPNDTNKVFHTNTGIIGTMGTGKTQFTKSLITQLYREQKNNVEGKELGVLIFDYKGDYNKSKEDFIKATNAEIYPPYHLPFNPLSLIKSAVFKPLLPTHTANSFKDTLSRVYNLGPKQQNILLQCILDTYNANGIIPNNKDTWGKIAPTFEQVYQRYINDDEIKKGDSLSAALDTIHMFEIFQPNPYETRSLFELLNGVVVIDLSGYDPNIQNLIIAITLDLFYSQMQALGSSKMQGNYRQLTKFILVDEADNFMSKGFPVLKKILKEGREFGVGTILSTQFLTHFGNGEDDYSKYILTWVVHNVSDLKNSDVEFVFKSEAKGVENQQIYNSIKALEKHHSIIKIGNSKPIYLKDKAFWELYSELN